MTKRKTRTLKKSTTSKVTAMQLEFARLHKELAKLGDRANALFAKTDVSYRQNILWLRNAEDLIQQHLAERNDIKNVAVKLDAKFQRLIDKTYKSRWPR